MELSYSPAEIAARYAAAGEGKAKRATSLLIVLGMVAGPLLLLVLLNLCKLGTFDPLWRDIRLCAGDLNALLAPGRQPEP